MTPEVHTSWADGGSKICTDSTIRRVSIKLKLLGGAHFCMYHSKFSVPKLADELSPNHCCVVRCGPSAAQSGIFPSDSARAELGEVGMLQ